MKNAAGTSSSVWMISEGRFLSDETVLAALGNPDGPVKTYDISDISRYLLDPAPVDIVKHLVGAEIHYNQPPGNRWRRRLRRWLPAFAHGAFRDITVDPVTLITDFSSRKPALATKDLERHFDDVYASLSAYDTFNQQLLSIDAQDIADVLGICEDAAGNRTPLAVQGSLAEKMDYLQRHVGTAVRVRMENVQVADGLFEMSGFDFTRFRPGFRHRMVKLYHGDALKACVLAPEGAPAFWVKDVSIIRYLQLAEHSIRINHKFREAMQRCMIGKARPMKLMFNSDLEIDYSQANLPPIIEKALEAHRIDPNQRDAVKQLLNRMQIGISFNYVPFQSSGEERLCTDISVMQDIRALDAIKDNLPTVYSEMSKRSLASEAGKFYLLEAIRGIRHAQ
jgi:hypothetical protein